MKLRAKSPLLLIVLSLCLGASPIFSILQCPSGEVPGGFQNLPFIAIEDQNPMGCPVTIGEKGAVYTHFTVQWGCHSGNCRNSNQQMSSTTLGSGECYRELHGLTMCFAEAGPAALNSLWEWELEKQNKFVALFPLIGCANAPPTHFKATCDDCLPCEETASPILVSLGDQRLELTSLADGVRFDLDADGAAERVAWTAPGAAEGFLVLDRNRNEIIDSGRELFGDHTPQPPGDDRNGFRALAVFDDAMNGGDEDGLLTATDAIFSRLALWIDADHDGVSQADEIRSLAAHGIEGIDLAYRDTARTDRHGNEYRYRSKILVEKGGTRPVWDVFLVTE